jgi:uncharacterized membrane protein
MIALSEYIEVVVSINRSRTIRPIDHYRESLDEQIEVELLKYNMEDSLAKKKTIKTKIAVLELKKEQITRSHYA